MASVTTTFRPDPTCFAPSNLWLGAGFGCETYYPPFSSRPTEVVALPDCPLTQLGRPGNGNWDDLCYQDNWISTGSTIASETAYSACPEGMTGARTVTTSYSGIVVERTACCPTAYDFAPVNVEPTVIPTVVDGTTYPMTYRTLYELCKAASIKELSDQTVTMTVSTSSTLSTTEVAWDYENGFIVATPAMIQKYLYTGRPGTTSTCFGDSHCVMNHNPIEPRPTYAPFGTYVPPPSTAVTQFTPAPSCLAESNVWLVSDRCSLTTTPRIPPWLQCTHTVAGNPDFAQGACYPGPSTVVSGTPTYYTACPVGYTTANSTFYKPFNEAARTYEVEASRVTCCPSAFGDVTFTHTSPGWTYTTIHDGTVHRVSSATLPPFCAASRVSQLKDKTLTMGLYSNGAEEGRPGRTYDGASEAVWDAAQNTMYAEAQTVSWTVFHGTHTCFEWSDCNNYFTYSYGNTMGPGIPVRSPSTTAASGTQEGGGDGPRETSSPSTGAAAAVMRGDGRAGLSVVVVVVTVMHVAIGVLG
ncbi:hypothetical protein C8A00DRAFT_19712 [Chaetomidium leptoderma]|uniref:Uncharacterized protein n=1 Tax=Chaetomidium leptoderma TaxID=669021 RepID=A0AAN6ZSD4_9PEZI|nr:hypothetical protein C8A00DRAFT_19712 [Chaetomidium leptoderma]